MAPFGICVLYQKNELSAERMYLVEPIIKKYIQDNGCRLDRNAIYFLEISSLERRHPRRDYSNLKRMSRSATIFVSQLNSTSCQYLQQIFFDAHPETVHVNSVSTATSLTYAKNLIRYQVPDIEIQRIYLYNIQRMPSCVIVYQPGVYYEDLSLTIQTAAMQAGIPTLRLLKENFDLGVINNFVTDPFSIVFVVDDPLTYIRSMQTDPTINQKRFQILISDAGVQQLTADASLLEYLNQHQTRLYQFFIDARQLALAQEYEAYINDPLHPVSTNVALLFIVFDWAVLISNTLPSHRLTRQIYLDLYLDSHLDNTNSIYGGYVYVPNNLEIATFYFVYQAVLYVGAEIASIPSSLPVKVFPWIHPVPEISRCFPKIMVSSSKMISKSSEIAAPSSLSPCENIGLCVLYDEDGFAAERCFEVKRIIRKYIQDNGLDMARNRLTFLQLSAAHNPDRDRRHLRAVSRCHKVFVSALGTGRCQYLTDIFFNRHLDCIHVNSFSTASELSVIPNLARFQASDTTVVKVYLYQIQLFPGNCVIVYEDGIYSTSLSLQIATATTQAGIPTLRIHKNEVTPAILNSFTTNNFTIVYVLGDISAQVAQLQADPTINQKNFQILVSDSASLDVPTDPGMINYLNSKQARLIQKFLTDRQLALATEYNQFINNPEHPVSTTMPFLLSCFDWAILVTNTMPSHRLTRLTYQNLQLNRSLENTNTIYGTYRYTPNGLVVDGFFFIYEERLYVGTAIN